MLLSSFVPWGFSIGLMLLGADLVFGQDYPTKPIRIVTTGVGGGSDFTARLIAQGLSGRLGQQGIVDNRPSGVIPGETVAKAPPDGYTLLLMGATFWIGPLLQATPYDVVRDFLPITLVGMAPNVLVVHPSLPPTSVKELIALAKARPGELNYSSGGTGASGHLAAELFKAVAGVNIVRVSYKSGSLEINDLLAGQVQLTFNTPASVMRYVKSERLRALAVTSTQPSALVPGLPTVAASGLPGYEAVSTLAMFAPAKTPSTIINRLNQEIMSVLNQPDVKQKFFDTGVEAVASSPEQLAAAIKSEMTRWSKVIKDAGIKAD